MRDKRTVDMQVMSEWVEPGSRVLDLGCGRGVLLDYLKQKRQVKAIGVDMDQDKVRACIKRGLSVYMGDMMEFMRAFPDRHFDYVICSRTVQELMNPREVVAEALRVSNHLLVGFVNFGYWRNRLSMLRSGHRIHNEVYPHSWSESRPTNPISVDEFESFCSECGISVKRLHRLRGDWRREATFLPNWLCGYALYDLEGSKVETPSVKS